MSTMGKDINIYMFSDARKGKKNSLCQYLVKIFIKVPEGSLLGSLLFATFVSCKHAFIQVVIKALKSLAG